MGRVHIGNVYPSDDYLLARCAPTGYGWGEGSPAAHFNASNVNRTAVFVSVGGDMPTNDSVWLCEFYATSGDGSGNYGHMVATCQGGVAKGCCCIRLKENGVYSEWEWVNPPMLLGVEYRTTERWNGKPVYTSLVNVGAYQESGMRNANTGIIATGIIRFHASIGYTSLPLSGNMEINTFHNGEEILVQLNTKGERIYSNDVYVTLYYIKN